MAIDMGCENISQFGVGHLLDTMRVHLRAKFRVQIKMWVCRNVIGTTLIFDGLYYTTPQKNGDDFWGWFMKLLYQHY